MRRDALPLSIALNASSPADGVSLRTRELDGRRSMDIDSALIMTSFAGLLMAPFWSKWWNAAFRRIGASRSQRIAGVLLLSIATIIVVHVGPWIVLSYLRDTIAVNLADPRWPIGMLIIFGSGILLQTFVALHFALKADG